MKNKVDTLFKSIKNTDEFEVMFNNYKQTNKLSLIDFMKILKYLKIRSDQDNLKLVNNSILDIIYQGENKENLRISIENQNNINDFLSFVHQRKNNKLMSILVNQYRDKNNFKFIKKIKNKANILDFDDFDIRFRIASEDDMNEEDINILSNLKVYDSDKIIFRYKQRLTLEISENIIIDLTIVKTSSSINDINNEQKSYELEIEYLNKKKIKNDFDNIFKEIVNVKKVLVQSDNIISNEESEKILNQYKKLMFGTSSVNFTNLYTMQPISAEVQRIIDNIPNSYSATDKADGDKYQLFNYFGRLFLISNNLSVKEIQTYKEVDELDFSIFEGELIFSKEKYIFMIYDCLYYDNKDIKKKQLTKRLSYVYKFCKEVVNFDIYNVKDYSGDFKMDKINNHYQKEIENYFETLNSNIKKVKDNEYLLNPKLFLFPQGGSNSEIFLFSKLIWNNCTRNTKLTVRTF